MDEHTVQKLTASVDKLNANLEKQNSFKFVVLRGLVYGISIVIGTTILAGIVLSFLGSVPLVDTLIEELRVRNSS